MVVNCMLSAARKLMNYTSVEFKDRQVVETGLQNAQKRLHTCIY